MRRRGENGWQTPEVSMTDAAAGVAEAAWKEYAGMRKRNDTRYRESESGHAYSGFAEALLATRVAKMAGIFGPPKSVEIERSEKEDDDKGVDLIVTLDGAPVAIDATCAKDVAVLQKKVRNTERTAAEISQGTHAGEKLPRAVLAMTQEQMYSFFEAYARVQQGQGTLKDLREHPLVGEMQAQLAQTLTRQAEELERKFGHVPEGLHAAKKAAEQLPAAQEPITNEYLLAAQAANESSQTRYTAA